MIERRARSIALTPAGRVCLDYVRLAVMQEVPTIDLMIDFDKSNTYPLLKSQEWPSLRAPSAAFPNAWLTPVRVATPSRVVIARSVEGEQPKSASQPAGPRASGRADPA